MINMGKTMLMARQYLYFGLFLNIPIVASQTTVNGYVGQEVKIPCGVGGTYTLPQWRKGVTPLTSQDVARLNPAYPRFSYDADQKTLVVSSAQEEDSGTYECTHTVGTNSPQNTIVVITEATTTQPESKKKTEEKNGKKVQTANCVFYPPNMVVVTVVIIICSYILINAYKERKHNNKMEDKQNNKIEDKHINKMEDKHNIKMEDKHNNKMADKQNENKKKKKIKVVVILTIVEVLLFIIVSVWFIVIQSTVEDFEKLTTTEHIVTIILLVVEIVVLVQGVIAIFVFWKNRGSANKSNRYNADDPTNLDRLNC